MKNLVISFSGGRTSAYMAKRLLDDPIAENQYFVFMNTGAEDERTLEFINKCDKEWGLNLIWIEALVNPEKGKRTNYKVVDFESASRECEPFYDVIKKYGIPNSSYPHCNRELKLQPFNAWLADTCPDAHRAIGIRLDEIDRMAANMDEMKIIYPLISKWPTMKGEILAWWEKQSFNLDIPEHYGNCVTCWKKSDRKLLTLAKNEPKLFGHFQKMELIASERGSNAPNNSGVFFRKHRSAKDILRESEEQFNAFEDKYFNYISDISNGCSESCDLFG